MEARVALAFAPVKDGPKGRRCAGAPEARLLDGRESQSSKSAMERKGFQHFTNAGGALNSPMFAPRSVIRARSAQARMSGCWRGAHFRSRPLGPALLPCE